MKDINLISFRVDDKTKKNKIIILAGLFLIAVVISASFIVLLILNKKNVSDIAATKKELTKYVEVTTVKTDMKMYNEKLKQMKNILDSVSEKSVLNIKLLKDIASAMPSDVYISNYAVSKTGDITLVGKSGSNDSIAYFRYKLDETKQFDDIEVKSIKLDSSADSSGDSLGDRSAKSSGDSSEKSSEKSSSKNSAKSLGNTKKINSAEEYTFDISLKLKR